MVQVVRECMAVTKMLKEMLNARVGGLNVYSLTYHVEQNHNYYSQRSVVYSGRQSKPVIH